LHLDAVRPVRATCLYSKPPEHPNYPKYRANHHEGERALELAHAPVLEAQQSGRLNEKFGAAAAVNPRRGRRVDDSQRNYKGHDEWIGPPGTKKVEPGVAMF
jgi:hypothetical protein